jgi:hypothetical protein
MYETYVVFVFNNEKGNVELRLVADSIEQRSGWVLALYRNHLVGGVKEEHLKAFYIAVGDKINGLKE